MKQTGQHSLQQGALSCKPTVGGNSLCASGSLSVSIACITKKQPVKKRAVSRQKSSFQISVPYCIHYITLVTVLQDFFVTFFSSLSRKYSGKYKKNDRFVEKTQRFWNVLQHDPSFFDRNRQKTPFAYAKSPSREQEIFLENLQKFD